MAFHKSNLGMFAPVALKVDNNGFVPMPGDDARDHGPFDRGCDDDECADDDRCVLCEMEWDALCEHNAAHVAVAEEGLDKWRRSGEVTTVRVLAVDAYADPLGEIEAVVTIGAVTGTASLCADEVNGGLRAMGDCPSAWLSPELFDAVADAVGDAMGEIIAQAEAIRG